MRMSHSGTNYVFMAKFDLQWAGRLRAQWQGCAWTGGSFEMSDEGLDIRASSKGQFNGS